MNPVRFLEGLFGRLAGRRPSGYTDAALLDVGSAGFRDIAVPRADGTLHVVAAHRFSAAFHSEHAELVRTQLLPPPGRLVPVQPAEIARMRAVPGTERDRSALTSGARRVEAAIMAAAALIGRFIGRPVVNWLGVATATSLAQASQLSTGRAAQRFCNYSPLVPPAG